MKPYKNEEKNSLWPVIVLTLEGDDDRSSKLRQSLDDISVDYQVHYGVDGRQGLSPAAETRVDRAVAYKKYRRHLSDGEFACGLSHQDIYRRVLAQGWPGAIVLEDDAILTDSFREFVEERCYTKADLIMLDHSHARVRGRAAELSKNIQCKRLSLPASLTTGYSLSARAARFLIDVGTPLADVADWPGDITKLGAQVCVPTVVTHTDKSFGPSHLRHERTKGTRDNMRFLKSTYWRKWIAKRLSHRVS